MKKATYNFDGSRQIVSTGWKQFDTQTNCITYGNVLSNTQYSGTIRPYNETECCQKTFEKGKLMDFDLEPFKRHGIPNDISAILKDKERKEKNLLYMFYVRNKKGHAEPFGWVLTTMDRKLLTLTLVKHRGQQLLKRSAALNEAIQYITD